MVLLAFFAHIFEQTKKRRHPPRLPQDPRLLRGRAELTLIVMLSLVDPLKRVLSFFYLNLSFGYEISLTSDS
jgi:hypothetical protein